MYDEPRNVVLNKITPVVGEPEMTTIESGFLCGLLREHRPKKIVEIGVAAGGTTAIVLQCLQMLGLADETEMFSIDYCERFYRDDKKKSGFMAEEAKSKLNLLTRHRFLLGDVFPSYIEEIGGGIDFAIIDTVHVLPGELLDFLAIYPYLSSNAIVVLHDILENFLLYQHEYATRVLFSSVVADKYTVNDSSHEYGMPNIGAFQINEDTFRYIENCFSSLFVSWNYMPPEREIKLYRQCFEKHYDSELLNLYDAAVELNRLQLAKPIGCKHSIWERIKHCGKIMKKGYFW